MLSLSDYAKRAFSQDSVHKTLKIVFSSGKYDTITNESIVSESLSFTESVCSRSEIKFGLCESAVLEFECVGLPNVKGEAIYATISVPVEDSYRPQEVPLGHFIIDSCDRTADMKRRKIVAYSPQAYTNWDMDKGLKDILIRRWDSTRTQTIPVSFFRELAFPTPSWGGEYYWGRWGYNYSDGWKDAWLDDYGDISETSDFTVDLTSRLSVSTTWKQIYSDAEGFWKREYRQNGAEGIKIYCKYVTWHYCPVRDFPGVRSNWTDIAETIAIDDYEAEYDTDYLDAVKEAYARIQNYALSPGRISMTDLMGYLDIFQPYSFQRKVIVGTSVEENPLSYGYQGSYAGLNYGSYPVDWGTGRVERYPLPDRQNTRALMHYQQKVVSWDSDGFPKEFRDIANAVDVIIPYSIRVDRTVSGYTSTVYQFDGYAPYTWLYRHRLTVQGMTETAESDERYMTFPQAKRVSKKVYSLYTGQYISRNEYELTDAESLNFSVRDLVEGMLELRGRFGRLDRTGAFQEVDIGLEYPLYPRDDLYPAMTLEHGDHNHAVYPEGPVSAYRGQYRSAWYDDDYTLPYGGVCCTYKDSSNNENYYEYVSEEAINLAAYQLYNLSDNYFVREGTFTEEDIADMCQHLYERIKTISFMPADIVAMGFPFLEAGDMIQIVTQDGGFYTAVLRRTLKGIQTLTDSIQSK